MISAPENRIIAVAERLFPGATIESVDGRSWLFLATTGTNRYSVRQLDPGIPIARIEIVQEFLSQSDLSAITPIVTTDRQDTVSIDIREWVDGTVLGLSVPESDWKSLHLPASIETQTLATIAQALGRLHQEGSSDSLIARAPHFRLKEILTQTRRSLDLDERALAGEIRKESRARRWLTASRPLLTNAESTLEQVDFLRDESTVIAHLDLWGSHIVSTSADQIVFLDFARIGVAPPIVDLARLILRNGSWSDDRVEQVLNHYTEEHPISPLQRRVLPWLAAIDAISLCGQLLVRAHDDRRPLSDANRRLALNGADQLLDELQTLATAFVPPAPRQRRFPGQRSNRRAR